MEDIRLNKLLSQRGIASRRAADDMITQGRVDVNGKTVTALGTRVDPEHDDIRVDGRRLKGADPRRYLLMYKPAGVVSTRSDPQERRTVIDMLATAGIEGYFYPVGRLDYESEGLILLTNDGEFAERVTHPRYELTRTYEAVVEGVPDERDLDRLRHGMDLDGERTLPAEVHLVRTMASRSGEQTIITLTLREGRNRQVRRMCDAIAHPVDRLRRLAIGPVTDPRIRPGQIRDLTPSEIRALTAPVEAPQGRPSGPRRPRSKPPGAFRPHAKPRPHTKPGSKPDVPVSGRPPRGSGDRPPAARGPKAGPSGPRSGPGGPPAPRRSRPSGGASGTGRRSAGTFTARPDQRRRTPAGPPRRGPKR